MCTTIVIGPLRNLWRRAVPWQASRLCPGSNSKLDLKPWPQRTGPLGTRGPGDGSPRKSGERASLGAARCSSGSRKLSSCCPHAQGLAACMGLCLSQDVCHQCFRLVPLTAGLVAARWCRRAVVAGIRYSHGGRGAAGRAAACISIGRADRGRQTAWAAGACCGGHSASLQCAQHIHVTPSETRI